MNLRRAYEVADNLPHELSSIFSCLGYREVLRVGIVVCCLLAYGQLLRLRPCARVRPTSAGEVPLDLGWRRLRLEEVIVLRQVLRAFFVEAELSRKYVHIILALRHLSSDGLSRL